MTMLVTIVRHLIVRLLRTRCSRFNTRNHHLHLPLDSSSGEVVTNGTLFSSAHSERGRQDGLVNRPASRRVASRSSARGFGGAASTHGKKDLRDLLSSIGTEEEDVAEAAYRNDR